MTYFCKPQAVRFTAITPLLAIKIVIHKGDWFSRFRSDEALSPPRSHQRLLGWWLPLFDFAHSTRGGTKFPTGGAHEAPARGDSIPDISWALECAHRVVGRGIASSWSPARAALRKLSLLRQPQQRGEYTLSILECHGLSAFIYVRQHTSASSPKPADRLCGRNCSPILGEDGAAGPGSDPNTRQ